MIMANNRKDAQQAQDAPRRINRGKERLKMIRDRMPKAVTVVAANEDLRRVLAHPNGGGFRKDGTASWPDDSFTRRRIRDGDVTVQEETAQQEQQPRRHSQRHAP